MAVRPSMSYLITFVRDLINDTAGASQQFTDQQIQDRLDLNRLDLYASDLKPADTLASDGTIDWLDWFARLPFWETDYVIQEIDGDASTPNTAEPLIGKFHYNTHQTQPLVITGRVYNVYGVAATMMTMWVAEIRSQVTSWTADGTTVQRTGQIKTMTDLAAKYYAMAWGWGGSTQVKLVRKDLIN